MVTTDDLAAVPLFDALDDAALAQVAQWFHVESAGKGATLVGEGAHGYTFFVLAEGTAAVTSDGEAVASLGPGDFFGEVAILGAGRRTASVTSTSPVRLLAMFGTEFRQLEAAYPEIASRLGEAMEARLAAPRPASAARARAAARCRGSRAGSPGGRARACSRLPRS